MPKKKNSPNPDKLIREISQLKPGIVPDSLILEMFRNGNMSFTNDYHSDMSKSPSTLSLLLSDDFPQGKDSMIIEPRQSRDFSLNVHIARTLPEFLYCFADATTTAARQILSVVVYDGKEHVLPFQPDNGYEGFYPNRIKGVLRATVTANGFPVAVKRGEPIANLRIFNQDPIESLLDPNQLEGVMYFDGENIPPTTDGKYLVMRLNLKKPVDGNVTACIPKMTKKPAIPEKAANYRADFFSEIMPRMQYRADGRVILARSMEELNLVGVYNGESCGGVQFRNGIPLEMNGDQMIINHATMLEPEPKKTLLFEIEPKHGTMLCHGEKLSRVGVYGFCRPPHNYLKPHNSGNRNLPGKYFI